MYIKRANIPEDRSKKSSLEKLKQLIKFRVLCCTIFLLAILVSYSENRKGL